MMTVQPVQFYSPLRLIDRLVALCAWGLAIALFFTVGWRALQPEDPQGAVSMLTCRNPWWMAVQMAGLGAVTAAVATLLVGRKLADAGVFAMCLGLAAANLRAETLAPILIALADREAETGPNLAAGFLVEVLVWSAAVALAMVTSGLVLRWCFGRSEAGITALSCMAAAELPLFRRLLPERNAAESGASVRTGVRHLLCTVVVAFVLIGILATGAPAPAIRHGQVYFSITAAFCAAGYLAHSRFPARTPMWTCLAVPLVSLSAYVWVMLVGTRPGGGLPPNLPHSAYLRALPLEYVTLGTLGSILAFWWTRHTYVAHQLRRASSRSKPV